MTTTQNFDDAFQQIAARQRSARRRAWLAILLPAGIGAAFLVYGSWQLQEASRDVAALRTQATDYRQQVVDLSTQVEARTRAVEELQSQLQTVEARLKETTELSRFVHPLDFVDQKAIYSTAPRTAPVLGTILELRERGTSWRLGGTSPDQGFDSPSFAAFVLDRHGALPRADAGADEELLPRSRRLFEALPAASSPEPGDLVFYPAGYALFWYVDQRNKPFVIGMTPSGITALEPDFAERVGVRRPAYR